MWKNWRQPQAAAPQANIMSYDDYYEDDRYLETIQEVESIRERPQSVAHPPAALPELPFRAVPPLQPDNGRIPSSVYSTEPAQRNSRIASSLYSQPSPTYPPDNIRTAIASRKSVGDEISPVSTPRSSNFPVDSDTSTVSPIEPTFSVSARIPLPEHNFKSHLPRPVPSTSTDSTTPPHPRPKKKDTKWDDYSGEPADTGKRGSVQLGPDQLNMQFPQLKERTRQILAGLRDSEAKKKNWERQLPPVEDSLDAPLQQKPPWKGASGREATVDPVRNTPGARKGPLQIPLRNPGRPTPVVDARTQSQSPETTTLPGSPVVDAGLQPVREPSPGIAGEVPTPRQDHSIRIVPSQESVKPIAPLKTRQLKDKSHTDPGNDVPLQSPFQSPLTQIPTRSQTYETNRAPGETPAPAYDHDTQPSTPIRRSSLGPTEVLGQQSQYLDPSHIQNETSRFSWTTYATTTVNSSPPSMAATTDDSPVPRMPPMPLTQHPTNPKPRPLPPSSSRPNLPYSNSEARFSTSSVVSRKPVGDRRRSSSILSSTAKDLPPPPPQEVQTGDKVTSLEAKQNHLASRKRNNTRIRRELSDTLKRNAIIYDIYKRRDVEGRIKELEQERDAILQEEHDVGVQLHRAQKKRDNADEYGRGTALWINRVTQ